MNAGNQRGVVARCRYLRKIDGLVMGHDPRNGYVDDRTYIIPAAKLAFDVRRGWSYEQRGRRLEIWNAKRDTRAMVLQVNRLRGIALTASLSQTKTTRIAGRRADVGWMRIDSTSSPLRFSSAHGRYWARVAIIHAVGRDVVAAVSARKKSAVSASFATSLRPRAATTREIANARPKRLRTKRQRRVAKCL